jgi:hypothetical protein
MEGPGVLGPSLIIGAGLALSFVALTIASVSGIEAEDSGVAGGLINMTQSVGGRSDSPSSPRSSPAMCKAAGQAWPLSTAASVAAAVPARSHRDH